MTRKQIDASRELRLWIGQVIVPAMGVAAMMSNKEVKDSVSKMFKEIKNNFRSTKN